LFLIPLPESDARGRAADIVRQRPNSLLFQMGFAYGGNLAAVCDRIALMQLDTEAAAAI
jgi:hypothetical protein